MRNTSNKRQNAALKGEVAIVTGGGRGLGLSIARALAGRGATVCLTGRNPDDLETAAEQIQQSGGQVETAAGDVTDSGAMSAAVARFRDAVGPASILVNNAGIGLGGPVAQADVDAWWRVFEVNVKGPMLMSRLVLPDMLSAGRGCIINLGSYAAIGPGPNLSAYSASKAALLRLTDSLDAEVVDRGITVIAVSPGWVWTDMTREADAILREIDPDWEGIDPDYIFGPEAVSDLVCRVAAGDAQPFHGRLLHVKDDLDALLENADEILAADRFGLRLNM